MEPTIAYESDHDQHYATLMKGFCRSESGCSCIGLLFKVCRLFDNDRFLLSPFRDICIRWCNCHPEHLISWQPLQIL